MKGYYWLADGGKKIHMRWDSAVKLCLVAAKPPSPKFPRLEMCFVFSLSLFLSPSRHSGFQFREIKSWFFLNGDSAFGAGYFLFR